MSVMTRMNRLGLSLVFAALTLVSVSSETRSQSLPNPYRMVDSWAQMPEGREMGALATSQWTVMAITSGPLSAATPL